MATKYFGGLDLSQIGTITAAAIVSIGLITAGSLSVTGSTTLGSSTSTSITVNGRFTTDLVPSSTNTRDLGSVTSSWRNVYSSGTYIGVNSVLSSDLTAGDTVLAPTIWGTSLVFAQDLLSASRLDMGTGEIRGLSNGMMTFDADPIGGAQATSVTLTVQGVGPGSKNAVYVSTIGGDLTGATSTIFLEAKPTALNTVTVYMRNTSSTTFNAGSSTIGVMGISW